MEQIVEKLRELALFDEVRDGDIRSRPFAVGAQFENAPLTTMLLDGHESAEDVEFDWQRHSAA
jgi:hypothetical protein